jgi:hypothetical protein
MNNQHNGRTPVRQSRRRRGSYQRSIEQRAAIAGGMIKENGWTIKQAAGLFCVNSAYVSLVRGLSDDDRIKLARGELKLAQLHKDYCRRLAERRAQWLAAEREGQMQAEREAQMREIDSLFDCVGVDRIIDRFVDRFGRGCLFQVLDVNLQWHGQDIVEVVIDFVGSDRAMRTLDQLTQPKLSLVAAE